ncbi:DMT family transporter [Legionella anisa]|uniref:EamA/RhaT family transporter n=2 Tax=Legionella anisa TaxID=28082 RepID=A0AAX0WSI0_9GAMM|nr:EamA/RhaT family transporter [Legionella anisa]KTC76221.1 transporter [Legionella anisa]PNL61491.1 EamA/RhaT family transporter [Legionella anisa]
MMINQEYRGSIYAILSGFLYGFIGYFGLSAMNDNLSASSMLFWRFLISSMIILIIMLPKIKKTNDSYKNMFLAFLTGAFFYGISTWLYFLASYYIGSGLAMVIFFTYPVLIMLLNFFFYEHSIPPVYYLAILVILMGMTLMVDLDALSFNLWGILLGIASAFFYACYVIGSKKNELSPNMSTFMVCLGCMVTSLLVSFFSHSFAIPSTMDAWYHLFGISVIATVAPIVLLLYSLKYISSEKASILSVLEPVFVVIFGVLLLGEKLNFWGAVGIVLVLTGALITLFSHKINLGQLKFQLVRSEDAG